MQYKTCGKCKVEKEQHSIDMRFSNIVSRWLCKDCFQLCINKFHEFKEEFLNENIDI